MGSVGVLVERLHDPNIIGQQLSVLDGLPFGILIVSVVPSISTTVVSILIRATRTRWLTRSCLKFMMASSLRIDGTTA